MKNSEFEYTDRIITFEEHIGTICGKKYCSGFEYSYKILIPSEPTESGFALAISFDNKTEELSSVMSKLYKKGMAPPAVIIGIDGGTYRATIQGGTDYFARPYSYDMFDAEFPNFIVEDLIPELSSEYELKISDDPDMHMAIGGSSGGICAWDCAWFRNDYFHRVYMSSPTFSSMNKGYMATIFMRLYETKAIKGFMDYSEKEPNEYFGDSYIAALNAQSALEYAGYDFGYRYNKGEGHVSRLCDVDGLMEAMSYVWSNYDTVPVKAMRNTKYIDKIVSIESKWEKTNESMPAGLVAVAANGKYTFESDKIYFTSSNGQRREVASGFLNISSIAVSSDMWRLYVAESYTSSIYAMAIGDDGSLKDRFLLCSLHTATDMKTPGAVSMCVDENDRIYAATELGIQVIRSAGIINAIFEYPTDERVTDISFDMNDQRVLYLKTDKGVYKRELRVLGRKSENSVSAPNTIGYY